MMWAISSRPLFQVPWASTWTGKVGLKGWMSVQAAVTAIVASDRMTDLLKRCIDFTGDVDTVAAIALGSAAACKEIEQEPARSSLPDSRKRPVRTRIHHAARPAIASGDL